MAPIRPKAKGSAGARVGVAAVEGPIRAKIEIGIVHVKL